MTALLPYLPHLVLPALAGLVAAATWLTLDCRRRDRG